MRPKPPALILVSLAKSGTHLLTQLLQAMDYEVLGPDPQTDILATQRWQEINPGQCAVVHSAPIDKIPFELAQALHEGSGPRVLFNIRDLRAIKSSFVRFLLRGEFSPRSELLIHADIVQRMDSFDQRLAHAISHPTFPDQNAPKDSSWLLLHPKVLCTRFEALVGALGGGSEIAQRREILAVMKHLDIAGAPKDYAHALNRRQSITFDRGLVSAWEEDFSPAHHRLFEAHHAQTVALYAAALKVQEGRPK